jgi:hypothetical protein
LHRYFRFFLSLFFSTPPNEFSQIQAYLSLVSYPNVSQFWTYGKDAFLKQPVYSRDFSPCRFCE